MRKIKLIFCALLFSVCCHPLLADDTHAGALSTDVIGINDSHLSDEYWVSKTGNAGDLLKSQAEISDFNRATFSSNQHMVDLAQLPSQLAGMEVKKRIQAISKPNKSTLYKSTGEVLAPEGYRHYTDKLALGLIPETVTLKFALVVRRTDMRAYPTDDRYYKSVDDQNLDRFQENGLFPGDALAVLHTSANKEWSFVQSYNYAAWVKSRDIAIGERQRIHEYQHAKPFLIISGDKVQTNFNPEIPALSELQLDMGIRLPLANRATYSNSLYGQNPYASHTILLPIRNADGYLEIKPALIARNQDVHRGYLPFTREHIIRQAFKFLGERYGWGHSYNARDCTGFIMEVYKTFGFLMPRNTGQQGTGEFGENTRFSDQSNREAKLEALAGMDIGDLIYVPGHVLMYIGDVNGEPYVIHDVSIFRYIDENDTYYEVTLNGVSETPFIPLYGSKESPYIDLMYNIKRIR